LISSCIVTPHPASSTLFPYTTLFRSIPDIRKLPEKSVHTTIGLSIIRISRQLSCPLATGSQSAKKQKERSHHPMPEKPVVIGVAGGSGSGKTSVTSSICQRFQDKTILVLEQDYYYKDQSHLPFEERLNTNYDHPLAFDNDLLISHIHDLLSHKPIQKPVYDYKMHTRSDKVI